MNLEKLLELKEKALKKMDPRVNKKSEQKEILVCGGTGCTSNNSTEIIKELESLIKEKNLDNVRVVRVGCFGLCARGPIIVIRPSDNFYALSKVEDMKEIIESDIIVGQVVERLLVKENDRQYVKLDELPFYKKQKRIVLKNCGKIDPENILDYIAMDGYQALNKVLGMERIDVINIIKESGLRGRGGAGFPTGKKWEMGYLTEAKEKIVACNADEGDPGAFMDRSILEGDPHSVIEAMAICAYAIGANKGYIYVRKEYPIAVRRLEIAILQAKKYGFLGDNIFSTKFSFDIELRLGAGAFVCGEETALMQSVMGYRGEPRLRPPYPTTSGIFNKPTVLNNVETYANICNIILKGAEWFRGIGTETSPGTKVFALGGKVNNTGLIEVPMGTTLKEIVFDIGGGIQNGKEFKMAQTGGPSGGCIPKELINIKMEYDTLVKVGAMMGSGGLIVMDESTCAVDIAKYFLDFTVGESCGKCTPCRIGNKRLLEILDRISNGNGKESDIDLLVELSNHIKQNSLCGLGMSSPNPVLSTINFFKDEYIDHIENKHCKSGSCKELVRYEINPEKCVGCGLCKRNCPVEAISGEIKEPHKIDPAKCIRCGLCFGNCRMHAIERK